MATQKKAVRKITRGPDGKIKTIYVDAQTKQELTSLIGYTVNSQNELATEDFPHGLNSMLDMPHGLNAIEGFPLTPFLPGISDRDTQGSSSGSLSDMEWLNPRNGRDPDSSALTSEDRTPANNFGYVNKPGFLSLASALPGIPGIIGKGINAAVNANNVAAINAARETLGLPEQSTKEALRGIVQDNKGVVAEATIGNQQVAIGLEATTPSGRTTMTPQEALARAEANDVEIQEATPEAKEAAEAKFAEEYGKQAQGFLGNLKDIVKDVTEAKSPLANIKSPFANVKSPLTKSESKSKGKSKEAKAESKSTGIASPESAKNVSITPGLGLGNLTNRTAKTDLAGKSRGVAPDATLMDVIQQAVEQTLGPGYQAVVSSGTYSPEQQAAINEARAQAYQAAIVAGKTQAQANKAADAAGKAAGQVGTTRHTTGKAADFYIVDPQGNRVQSTEALKSIAASLASLGITGIGLGNPGGYMGGTSIHADVVDPSKATGWGGLGQQFKDAINDSIGLPNKFSPTGIPTPTASPRNDPVQDVATEGTQKSTTPEPVGYNTGFVGQAYGSGNDAQQAFAPMGFAPTQNRSDVLDPLMRDPRTVEEITALAKAIAGELGSNTLAGINSGDEAAKSVARQEIAAILGTIENRAASARHGGNLASVLTGSQYNSLMSSNLATTEANFQEFGDFITEAIQDYYDGTNPSPAPNATHYWNPSIVSPSWSDYSKDGTTDVGEHTFSDIAIPGTNVSEYSKGLPNEVNVSEVGRPSFTTEAVASGIAGAMASGKGTTSGSSLGLSGSASGLAGLTGAGKGTISVNPNTGIISFDVVSPEEYAAAVAASQPAFTGNVPSFSYASPSEAFANYGVNTTSVGPGSGVQMDGLGAFGSAPGSGYGGQAMAGLQGMTGISSSFDNPTGIAGTGIGYGFDAGSLGGTASGFGSGFGAVGTSGYGSFSGGTDAGTDFGGPGTFGGSFGGGYGSQSTAGATSESIGAGGYSAPSAESSFGGFNAGSLGGSASGFGSGFGAVGSSNTGSPGYSGFSQSGLGNYSGGTSSSSSGSTSSSGSGSGSSSAGKGGGGGYSGYGGLDSPSEHGPGPGSGSGDAGGDTILCTYFHGKGRLSDELYFADSSYGAIYISEDTMNGYQLWAEPIVEYLKKKKHPILEEFLFFFVKGWATEMAYRMGVEKKSNFIGRQICNFGEAICSLIGKATRFIKRPLKENT